MFVIAYPHDDGLGGLSGRAGGRTQEIAAPISDTPLLPTPCAERPDGRKSAAFADSSGNTDNSWGEYAPAIRRWEHILGREAPAPTTLSAHGKPHLSPAFEEWMMGLPQGWVTDIDISRATQLRALGNGVVPQQGATAITHLLTKQRTTNLKENPNDHHNH